MQDLIRRQAAIDAIEKYDFSFPEYMERFVTELRDAMKEDLKDDIANLPSAQPERKTGWWLIREGISDAQCSECKMYFRDVYDMDNSDAFCRHCGAKMEGLKVVKDE